jgi:magnesium transporter
MLHIRALIKPDCIIVFDSAGSTESEISRKFKWHLERNIKAGLAAREDCYAEAGEEDIGLVYEHRYVAYSAIERSLVD